MCYNGIEATGAHRAAYFEHKATRNGYGQIEITVKPRSVKIVDRTESRFEWK